MELELSHPVAEILKSSGWFPGRRSLSKETEELLISRGLKLSPLIGWTIDSFDGLTVRSAHAWMTFDAASAAQWYSLDELSYVSRIVGEPVCPLGQMSCAGFFGSASGQMVQLDMDWLLVNLAGSFDAFLRGFLLGEKYLLERQWLNDNQRPPNTG